MKHAAEQAADEPHTRLHLATAQMHRWATVLTVRMARSPVTGSSPTIITLTGKVSAPADGTPVCTAPVTARLAALQSNAPDIMGADR